MAEELKESLVRWGGDGYLFRGFLIAHKGLAQHPAVIVNPGAGGLNEGQRDVGRKLAHRGYVALVVDPYSALPEDEIPAAGEYQRMMPLFRVLSDRSYMVGLHNAYDYLNSLPIVRRDRIGVLGFCASWSVLFACSSPKVKACVAFYNSMRYSEVAKEDRSVNTIDRIPNLWAPMLCHWGQEDGYTPLNTMEELRHLGAKHNKDLDVQIYPGCTHGFAEPGGRTYREKEAELAWERSFAFLEKHLA